MRQVLARQCSLLFQRRITLPCCVVAQITFLPLKLGALVLPSLPRLWHRSTSQPEDLRGVSQILPRVLCLSGDSAVEADLPIVMSTFFFSGWSNTFFPTPTLLESFLFTHRGMKGFGFFFSF